MERICSFYRIKIIISMKSLHKTWKAADIFQLYKCLCRVLYAGVCGYGRETLHL